jgi:hypothetical protein
MIMRTEQLRSLIDRLEEAHTERYNKYGYTYALSKELDDVISSLRELLVVRLAVEEAEARHIQEYIKPVMGDAPTIITIKALRGMDSE